MKSIVVVWVLAVGAIGAIGLARAWADSPDGESQLAENQQAENQNSAEQDDERPTGSSGQMTALIASLTVFVLAIFVGFEIITKVPPTLHTPLMSGSNAISGIAVVGALLVAGGGNFGLSRTWGLLAVVLATINVVGGFLVTHRMLAMFNKPRR